MKELLSRKYLISFFYIIVCIVGISSWRAISFENTPELNLPSITVSYSWGSTVPEIVEQEITRKVESAANRLRDVSEIRSITSEGKSSVTINFNKNAPVDFRSLELREYLNVLEDELPVSVSPVSISRSVPEELEDQQTFVVYTLSGDYEPRTLLEYANQSIKTKIMGLEGLSEVKLLGVDDPALMIEFNRQVLEKYKLSPQNLMAQIRERLSWRNAGYTESSVSRLSMIIPPEYDNIPDIAGMRISIPGSLKQLELSDVAQVKISDYPSKTKRRINGSPALTIEFSKEGGADAIALAETILLRMEEIKTQLPVGMEIRLQLDSTEQLREQFDQLATQASISGLLVFLVVLFFIRKMRAPLIIVGSVLFSVFLSITVLYINGYTLNMITLAGITIALGMLIDNAVVVFEQLNPQLPALRLDRIDHIRKELPKSLVPVLGSTFTTVGIFVPLLFAMDELRLFLLPLAVALTITLVSSVIIAFSWIPYALIWLSPVSKKRRKSKIPSKKNWSISRLGLLILIWRGKLRWVLLLAVIATVGIPIFLIEEPNWEEETLWPEFTQTYFDNKDAVDPWIGGLTYRFVNETYFGSPWRRNTEEFITVYIRSPQGTPLSEIDKIVANYEIIAKPYEQAFSYYEAQLSEYFGAYVRFSIKPDYLYKSDPYYFFGEAMYLAARTGNVATSVSGFGDGVSTGFGGQSSSHSIQLTGYSYDELYNLAKDIKRRLVKNRRVRDVDINSSSYFGRDDFQQYVLNLDEEKLLSQNLSKAELLQTLQVDLNPVNPFGKVEFGGQEMYLIGVSELEESYEENLMTTVRESGNTQFDLATFGTIKKEKALNEIRRDNQSYERSVSLGFLGNYRMGREYIQEVLKTVPVPVGAKISFGNSFFSLNDEENAQNLWLVALLAILSVWMIVSALLESWSSPLFVILAIPFCGIGIMLGTLANDLPFDRGAIAGSLLSIGVVVNNAILLIHQKQLENKQGIFGLRCWYKVFQKKLKTILITSITTIAGLLPMMLLGTNEFWETLAVIVIWGLLFSTGLILLMAGIWEKFLLVKKLHY